jgi:hypothetical protein
VFEDHGRYLSSRVHCVSLLERVPIQAGQNFVLVTVQNTRTSEGMLVSFYCRLNFCACFEVVAVEMMTI